VTFINPSPIPHSAVVVEKDTTKKLQMGEPYFDGAGVPKPEVGLSLTKAEFKFVADEEGEFALACGFPAHAINGHWLALNISDTMPRHPRYSSATNRRWRRSKRTKATQNIRKSLSILDLGCFRELSASTIAACRDQTRLCRGTIQQV
jgi:hypothetical protein